MPVNPNTRRELLLVKLTVIVLLNQQVSHSAANQRKKGRGCNEKVKGSY